MRGVMNYIYLEQFWVCPGKRICFYEMLFIACVNMYSYVLFMFLNLAAGIIVNNF